MADINEYALNTDPEADTLASDGKSSNTPGPTVPFEDERKLGFLLDELDEEKVAKRVVKMREEQEPAMSRRRAIGLQNKWWREGRRFVRLQKPRENESKWEAKLPLGSANAPPTPNKTDRLCRRVGNTLLVDPPTAECEPGDDSNEARDAAEFASRYIKILSQPTQLNIKRLMRRAFQKGATYMSGFAWVTIDPMANGKRPRKVRGHPAAVTQDAATIDPATGLEATEQELTDRYVRQDGTLTDNSDEADYQWLAGPKVRILTFHNLTFLPETCTGIDDCNGVIIADVTTLGELKAQFPEKIGELDEESLTALCQWRPDNFKDLLPAHAKEPEHQRSEDGKGWLDSQVVVVLATYYRTHSEYPCGAYVITGGDKLLLHRQKWTAKMPPKRGPTGKEMPSEEESLRIPIAQCRCLDDDVSDDPYGIALTERLGPADEITASSLGFSLEYMFRFGNPNVFLPHGSIIQPKQLLARDGSVIFTNPQGDPYYEPVPQLPNAIPALRQEMRDDQDDESGLQQSAQGAEHPNVKSGIHAQTIVGEAMKALTEMKDNMADFYVRLCELILEQSRAFIEVPQLLRYQGEDGDFKEEEFTRMSFAATRSVTIARGSFTLQTMFAKMQMAQEARAAEVIDLDELRETWTTGLSPVIGTQDNPHLLRVRRQIDKWTKGPPADFDQQVAAYQAAFEQHQMEVAAITARAQMGAGLGVQMAEPQLPPPPPVPGPFQRLAVDLEPGVAKIRHRQLARLMASSKYGRYSPNWQWVFNHEYDQMKNAAGIMTVPEVQKAKAQEAQTAAAAGARDADREFKDRTEERRTKLELADRKAAPAARSA